MGRRVNGARSAMDNSVTGSLNEPPRSIMAADALTLQVPEQVFGAAELEFPSTPGHNPASPTESRAYPAAEIVPLPFGM